MIELDDTHAQKKLLKKAGAKWIGNQGGLVWFTDLKTKSTLIMSPEDMTSEKIRRKLRESRKKFKAKEATDDHAA